MQPLLDDPMAAAPSHARPLRRRLERWMTAADDRLRAADRRAAPVAEKPRVEDEARRAQGGRAEVELAGDVGDLR